MKKETKVLAGEIQKTNINADEMTIVHYISTNTRDRYNEVMVPEGMDKTNFDKNPVVFFAHESDKLPIAKALWVKVDDTKTGILAKTQFDKKSEISSEIFRLFQEGFLNAWSIGFKYKEPPERIGDTWFAKAWELLEYSVAPVPANPDALTHAMKNIKNETVKEALMYTKEFQSMLINKSSEQQETIIKMNADIELLRKGFDEVREEIKDLEKRTAKKLFEIINR